MRTLSAVGFVTSILGLLLASYNQFAIVPFLHKLNGDSSLKVNEYVITMRIGYENQLATISLLCIIIGVFSVLFCSFVYLRKRTRMTFMGIFIGLAVAVMGIIHSWL